jgi:hypothetical protein
MKKRKGTVLLVLLCLFLTACRTESKTLDVKACAAALAEQGTYDDVLSETSRDIFEMLYYGVDMNTIEDVTLYMSTGATAEEVMVAKCISEKEAVTLQGLAQERLEYLKSSFENYVPKEVPKIEEALLQQTGCYVILCISSDSSKAAEILAAEWQTETK